MNLNIVTLNYSDNGRVVTVVFGDGRYLTFYRASADHATWIDMRPYRARRIAEC